MKARLRFFWERLNANYWFYPTLFAILAVVLGGLAVEFDRAGVGEMLVERGWIEAIGPQGASDILTVMAGALIGVAGTVFSITLVAVTYASGTYGPRLLTNFLEDRGNQVSLATFIAAFVYALIVLRSVRAEGEGVDGLVAFVPQLSVNVAYVLMGACIAVLVFFLHHVPSSIRINMVLQQIGKRLIATIRRTYPVEDPDGEARIGRGGEPLEAGDAGYVQLIDFGELEEIAREQECVFSLRVRTGDFVQRGLPLLDVAGAKVDGLEERVRACFTLGPVRTPAQDPHFLIDELVEIGLRALSPGINDPFTAITALHWLGAATSEIARRDLGRDVCGGADEEEGECPVIPVADDFAGYLSRGFGSIRSAVATSPNAALVMLDVIGNAADPIAAPRRLHLLREEGVKLMEQARAEITGPDLAALEARFAGFERRFAR
jgi:uncharacterized membrane protein